jgi:Fe-S-cluster containining protein
MDSKEFCAKVKDLADNRSTVWVTVPIPIDSKTAQAINSQVECEKCTKCCNGFWFDLVPLLQDDPLTVLDKTSTALWEGRNVQCIKQPCPYLKDNKCSIYEDRPKVCRMFPVMVEKDVKINVCCPAGLALYLKLAVEYGLTLDSEGL